MFDPQKKIHQINNMEHGNARLDALAQAIKEADDENQHYWRLYFRYEYITESMIHGDNFKGMLCFPEYLRIFDEHPSYEDDMYQDMMWAFKWLIGDLNDYYQITLDEVNHYFNEFRKRSQKYGFSLRTYYMKRTSFWLDVDTEQALKYYQNFQKYPRNRNSDCEACELEFKMKILLDQNLETQALETAEPILQHQKRCAEIPHTTYAELARYYFRHENFSEAEYYATLCEELIRNKTEFLRETGCLLEIYSRLNPNAGWRLFKYSLDNFSKCYNPRMKMLFAIGAYRLLQAISVETEFTRSPLLNVLPLKPSENGWAVQELISYFYDLAHDLAEKFDQRNQVDYYVPLLEKPLSEYSPESVFVETAKSVHGLVRKEQSAIVIFLNQKLSIGELESRIRNQEIVSCSREEERCFVSVKSEEVILECAFAADVPAPPLEDAPIRGMNPERLQSLLASPCCCVLMTEFSGNPLDAYHTVMHLLSQLFPELNGIVNLTAMKAYPYEWIRFAGKFKHAISPYDLYSIYLSGDQETGEIWGTTIGLCAFGMRELEIINATTEKFDVFAGMLDQTAALCIERNTLPDEHQYLAYCDDEEHTRYQISWENPESALKDCSPESIAVMSKREYASGILNLHKLPDIENLEIEQSWRERRRKIHLAEETFLLFRNALQKPYQKAVVRLGIATDEDYEDYDIELLWAEVNPDGSSAVLEQESEVVSEYKIGDQIDIDVENNLYDWRLLLSDEEILSPEDAWLLQEDEAL